MARTYTPTREYQFGSREDAEAALVRLDRIARSVLREQVTEMLPLEEAVHVHTNQGAEVSADTLKQAYEEMAEDALTPRTILVMFRLGHVGAHTVSMSVWDEDSVEVRFSSEDEGLVQGLASRFDREMNAPAPSAGLPIVTAVNPPPALATTGTDAVGPWYKRTWVRVTAGSIVGGGIAIPLLVNYLTHVFGWNS